MRRLSAYSTMMLLVVSAGRAAAQQDDISAPAMGAPSADSNPIDRMEWLVGGVWTAAGRQLGPHMKRIETRYQWSDNHSYIRFTSHFVTDSAELHQYDGIFYWDRARSTLAMWYMDSDHDIVQGPMTIEGDQWLMSFHEQGPDGKDVSYRVDIHRRSHDLYHWSLRRQDAATWKELLALDYRRSEGVASAAP
jgi:hypothetical protein